MDILGGVHDERELDLMVFGGAVSSINVRGSADYPFNEVSDEGGEHLGDLTWDPVKREFYYEPAV